MKMTQIRRFAIEAHHQTNHLYNGAPYSLHLAMVVEYAYKYKHLVSDAVFDEVIAACWLHDTIEDCRLTYNDVKAVAGKNTADIVYALTNEKGRNRKERAGSHYYDGIRNTPFATFVKMCDRLANVQYSYENDSRMFLMYRDEFGGFIERLNILNESHPCYPMAQELDELLCKNILNTNPEQI